MCIRDSGKDVHRVVFYEITRNAIREAISQPRHISQDLVNAQQARRALDYLVGFNLSPLLWKKAGLPGASAGRVQSPALRMICEREDEIARFKPREYWTVDADVEKAQQNFPARLIEYRGADGLITYMRTDSLNLANEAVQEIRQVIAANYGQDSLPETPRVYKTKSKNAQEAHEAIRPTSAAITPERLEGKIDPDQFKLYSLIWKRAVASQMEPAVYDTVAVDLVPGNAAKREGADAVLRANGSTLVKPGYIAVYLSLIHISEPT